MSKKRQFKEITDQKILDELFNITDKDISTTFMMDMFGEFNGKTKLNPYDIITVPKGVYGKPGYTNQTPIRTTAGLWIFNKYFIEPHFLEYIGYYNETITKGSYGALNKKLSFGLLEDDIKIEELKGFLNKTQKFMPYVSVISTHMTEKMLLSSDENNKKKKELMKKYKDGIDQGDASAVEQMENELIKNAKEYLKDDESFDSFGSGARGSWENNYKNLFVMRGAMKDPDPDVQNFNVVTDCYSDGISKENYAKIANSLAEGPYGRGKKTAIGGYWEKQFVNAFQHVIIEKDGSDCGTDKYLTFKLTNPNIWMYSYIIEGNNLVELTSKNVDKYKDKVVKVRFSSLCKSKKGICHKCAGNFFSRLGGVTHIGMATPEIPAKLKLFNMKNFHQSNIKYTQMDLSKAFGV